MSTILAWLDGKRTYITIVLGAVFNVGIAAGWWAADSELLLAINSVLAAFGIGFLRAGVNKAKK